MPLVTITMEVPQAVLSELFSSGRPVRLDLSGDRASKLKPKVIKGTLRRGLGYAPHFDTKLESMLRQKGEFHGRRGRPPALSVYGMEQVWKAFTAGHSGTEIARGLKGALSSVSVRNLLRKIQSAKVKS